ncbi:MAG: S-layer homology domain-containing protein [Clostridia bacterium]|nr:S-layer homology domain-containing protein [Clostridia bacterium]
MKTRSALCLLIAALIAAVFSLPAFAVTEMVPVYFRYEHDPRLNPSAMADIVADPSAVYGFSPSPDGSLKEYASFDWTDPELVNGENGREARIAYHKSIEELYGIVYQMEEDGSSVEEIARAVSKRRNEIRMESYDGDPEGLAVMKARNLEKYGHEEGPLPDWLYGQYGSWEKVIEKAFSLNSGMDACLGLYDDYYDIYVITGQVPHDQAITREYAAAVFADLFGAEEKGASGDVTVFSDGADVSPWLSGGIGAAVGAGILKGYEDGTLRPSAPVTCAEAAVMLGRFLTVSGYAFEETGDEADIGDVPDWATAEIDCLLRAGLIKSGDGFACGEALSAQQLRTLAERTAELIGLDISGE